MMRGGMTAWFWFWMGPCIGVAPMILGMVVVAGWATVWQQAGTLRDGVQTVGVVQQISERADEVEPRLCLTIETPQGRLQPCPPKALAGAPFVGQEVALVQSPDGSWSRLDGLEALAARNRSWARIATFVFVAAAVLSGGVLRSALRAQARGEAVWVVPVSVQSTAVPLGHARFYVSWRDPVTGRRGSTRALPLDGAPATMDSIAGRKGLRMLRHRPGGRLWWEGELPGFAPPLTRFPGRKAAGWPDAPTG